MADFEICYPNYSKKAITFTMDDGNLTYDSMLISIVSPGGIKGTFNLTGCNFDNHTREDYVRTYLGYEIANHCKAHPYCISDGAKYVIADGPFSLDTAEEDKLYPHKDYTGLYYIHLPRGWRLTAEPSLYCELIDIAKQEIEDVFGGQCRDFVWPFCEQDSALVMEHLVASGYRSVRRTGCTLNKDNFAVPFDKLHWSYNAGHGNLLEVAAMYEAAEDDGNLKMFAFGVHSIDFERSGKWDDLRKFTARYGGRPQDYWYATVGEIFNYASCAAKAVVDGGYIINKSDSTIYLKRRGKCMTLAPGCKLSIK